MRNSLNVRALIVKVTKDKALARCLSLAFLVYVGVVSLTVNSSSEVPDEHMTQRYFSPAVVNVAFSDSRGFAPVSAPADGEQPAPLRLPEEQQRWVF
ncbi:hypothetical protein BLL42_13760 [Pseudomonas frederiksbergensis]|uniref:Uncharacterized protein n=1 Tax=Pseudomonas frederiksbergensis TaxID=104087 RepID=A0A1J0EKT0_9PSED|nr:hypothetical protein [Pseudomonas frederiksbergensis]APC16741.1 hypothetical protein BLL42_13760 [Pseudomonas frederiksbergensis]